LQGEIGSQLCQHKGFNPIAIRKLRVTWALQNAIMALNATLQFPAGKRDLRIHGMRNLGVGLDTVLIAYNHAIKASAKLEINAACLNADWTLHGKCLA